MGGVMAKMNIKNDAQRRLDEAIEKRKGAEVKPPKSGFKKLKKKAKK